MTHGLADPLATARAIASIDASLTRRGYTAVLNTDLSAFAAVRPTLRSGKPVAAIFDPQASAITTKSAYWMSLNDTNGEVVALQAFRVDQAEPSLAEWVLGWMIGIYVKRSELVVPQRIDPPANSIARKISGTVVYHGELWMSQTIRGEPVLEPFARLGMLLAYIRWRPKAIWALTNGRMAYYANMPRWGYAHQEHSFLTWQLEPDGACPSEWLSVADRPALERVIREVALKRPEYRRELAPI